MPLRVHFNLVKADGQATSATFQAHLEAAVKAAPEDARAGYAPGEDRPLPRHKVCAAWLHCLRATLGEIAQGTTGLFPGQKPVSYSIVGKWRTEPAFRALIEKAQAEMVEALVSAYERGWDHASYAQKDDEAFEGFRAELRIFSEQIREQVILRAEQAAERAEKGAKKEEAALLADTKTRRSQGEHIDNESLNQRFEILATAKHRRGLEYVQLHDDFIKDRGGEDLKRLRRAAREAFPTERLLTTLVESSKGLFNEAKARGDWYTAERAFNYLHEYTVQNLAKLQAKQAPKKGTKGRKPKS
jgi:hypothetical protein